MTHALRLWRRHPVLAIAAIVSLALGIGANTAIFSVMNAVVLRPLPYANADRLVMVWETSADNPARWVAPATYLDWVRDLRAFSTLAAFDDMAVNLTGRGEPERLRAAGASGTFFATLGVTAAWGRTLLPADDRPGAEPVAVLTDGLAQRLFGSPAAGVGQSLTLEGRPHTVVGVLPATFSMPMLPNAELWLSSDRGIPRSFPFPGDLTAVRDSHILYVVGRLADGVTRAAAAEEVGAVMARLAREYPDTNAGLGASVVPLHEQVVGNARRLVVLLQLAVGLMLVIGCANVASLILGQAASRHAELAMRVALGASGARLVRQLLTETLVLALPGGLLGLLVALWGVEGLVGLAPEGLPRVHEIRVDAAVLAFTVAVTLAAAFAFGLGPALTQARRSMADAARQGPRVAGDRAVRRWHRVMAVGELAVAHVLLLGAGLLLASFLAAQNVELGFASEGRIAADVSLAPDPYLRPHPGAGSNEFSVDAAPKRRLVGAVLTRLRNTPGVRAAAASFTAPLAGAPNRGFWIDQPPIEPRALGHAADFQVVTPDYFRALGITLVRGRAFSDADRENQPRVAIVNQALVDRFLPGADPIGRTIGFGFGHRHQIVGVVADSRYRNVEQPAEPTFYVPLDQNDERWPFLSFTAWSDRDAAALAPVFRDAVREVDPNQPVARIRTYDGLLSAAMAPRRFNTLLVGLCALTALLLAAVGTFGVLAFSVASRRRELGVRSALGATPANLRQMVLAQGARLGALAVTLGLGAGLLVTRAMASVLYEVQPGDPRIYASVAGLIATVALVATWLPARGATRVDPITALRDD